MCVPRHCTVRLQYYGCPTALVNVHDNRRYRQAGRVKDGVIEGEPVATGREGGQLEAPQAIGSRRAIGAFDPDLGALEGRRTDQTVIDDPAQHPGALRARTGGHEQGFASEHKGRSDGGATDHGLYNTVNNWSCHLRTARLGPRCPSSRPHPPSPSSPRKRSCSATRFATSRSAMSGHGSSPWRRPQPSTRQYCGSASTWG